MRLRSSCHASLLLMMLGLAACGGDDSGTPDVPVGGDEDASRPDSSKPSEDKDAATGPKNDAGELDAAIDSGMDSMMSPFPMEDTSVFNPGGGHDAGPAPANWACAEDMWADEICDCGCGAIDDDCNGSSCADPGCDTEGILGCVACFAADLSWKQCGKQPVETDWKCAEGKKTDSICDCGCGFPDPKCSGSGCVGAGCYEYACQRRHDADGNQLTDGQPPIGWTCPKEEFGDGKDCDCGCGVADPDCTGEPNCISPKCTANSCDYCHDSKGRRLAQCSPDLVTWTCDALRYGSGDGCDCGCGQADPDCGENKGCSTYGCRDNIGTNDCKLCTDLDHANDQLVGCTPLNGWTCDESHYGTGNGCDCGCGIADPDCGAGNGCTDSGCTDGANKCDYCHDGATDVMANYKPCGGWTCGSETDAPWAQLQCDCGCGKPDPGCRMADREQCTGADCTTPTCEFCNEGNSSSRGTCDGPKWSNTGYCGVEAYGGDGQCDCGCGAVDSDCGNDEGCAEGSCAADGCKVCHDVTGALITCHEWTCPEEAYGDGTTCDCGCGAQDPDCSALGCAEPGCKRVGVCEVCHDPYGRTAECP